MSIGAGSLHAFRVVIAVLCLGAVAMPAGQGLAGTALAGGTEAFSVYEGTRLEPVDHSRYAAFLSRYVKETGPGETRVDYDAVTPADRRLLKAYIRELEAIRPTVLSRNDAFAYWVNLYNAVTLDVVLDHYPVASIRDIRFGLARFAPGLRLGPWREKLVRVAGHDLSLDDIEHNILRAYWDEPRVHFAVNCASVGCPALRPEPWRGAGLNAQLDEAARAFLNSERAIGVDDEGAVVVSAIFDWYGDDFADDEAGILDYIRAYLSDARRAALAGALSRDGGGDIDDYRYDWSLNDAGGGG